MSLYPLSSMAFGCGGEVEVLNIHKLGSPFGGNSL